jgi:methyl coenzyme M reductase subunit C
MAWPFNATYARPCAVKADSFICRPLGVRLRTDYQVAMARLHKVLSEKLMVVHLTKNNSAFVWNQKEQVLSRVNTPTILISNQF